MEQLDSILEKANKCLNCKNAKCKVGCPISTSIPEFIQKIKEKKLKEAYFILQENNLMSEVCSTICPVEKQCIGSCIRGIKQEPTDINTLEKFVNEWAHLNNIEYEPKIENICKKKVAIIGSGPAGLSCAIELAKGGADVTIFEKEENFGGILTYGIPDFRLSKDIVLGIIKKVKKLGVKFVNKTEFGKDITIDTLKAEGFDAIFLGIGAQEQSTYHLTNEATYSIYQANDFLKSYNTNKKIDNLGTVIVIGGGNVAIDSARAAIKQKAKKVYILYRRNEELMPARKVELEDAINDSIEIIYQTKVISAKVENNKIKEIECIKTQIIDNKAVDIENTNFTMEADTIIFAIGSKLEKELFDKTGIENENGLIKVDENYKTNVEGVYAGGDLVEAKSTVCRAIATGKKAAKAIIGNF